MCSHGDQSLVSEEEDEDEEEEGKTAVPAEEKNKNAKPGLHGTNCPVASV